MQKEIQLSIYKILYITLLQTKLQNKKLYFNAVIELIFELKSMTLIDKFVLLTEIEKIKKETKVKLDWHFDKYTEGYMDALEKIISIINALEVKSINYED